MKPICDALLVAKVVRSYSNVQTSLKRVNSDEKNPKSNSLTIARHLPVEIRKLLVIKEANLE